MEPGGRKVVWPEGLDVNPNCKVEVDHDTATMRVYEPEPSYDDVKYFILQNVTHYPADAVQGQDGLISLEDSRKYVLIDPDQLAEVIKRYFIDQEPQGSFPCKF